MPYPLNPYDREDLAPARGQMYDAEDNLFDTVDFLQALRDRRFTVQTVEPDKIIDLSPAVATGAHIADDVIVITEEITNAMRVNGGTARVQAITVNDLDDEGPALEIMFFDHDVNVGAAGATVDTGANGAAVLSKVLVYASDYSDYASSQTAVPTFQPFYLRSAADSRSIWYAIVVRDAVAALTAGGLRLRLHLQRN